MDGLGLDGVRLTGLMQPKRTELEANFEVHGPEEFLTHACARGSALSLSSFSTIATERIVRHSHSKLLSGRCVAAISPSMSVASFRASSKRSASARPQAIANRTSL